MSEYKNNYKIIVEGLTPEAETDDQENSGIKCHGFALIAFQEDGQVVDVKHATLNDMARVISGDRHFYAASILAKGIKESADIMRDDALSELFRRFKGD